MFGAGVAAGVEPDAALLKLKDGADDVAAPLVAPPPNRPPLGFAASPPEVAPAPPKRLPAGFAAAPPNPPKAGVVEAPDVAPPPKSPPGLLAGVLEAPPPNTLVELVAVFPLPNRVLPDDAPDVFAVPNSDGVAPPDEPAAAPNSGLAGVLLSGFWPPNVNDMMVVVVDV